MIKQMLFHTAAVRRQRHWYYLLGPYGKCQLTAVSVEMPCDGHSIPSTHRYQQSDANSLAGRDQAALLRVSWTCLSWQISQPFGSLKIWQSTCKYPKVYSQLSYQQRLVIASKWACYQLHSSEPNVNNNRYLTCHISTPCLKR